jgi:hypothetical protein
MDWSSRRSSARRRKPTRVFVSGVVLAVAVLVAACGGGSSPAAAPAAGSKPPPSTASRPDAGAAVLSAYRGMWSDLVTAAKTSDFRSPLLSRHASGDALTLFTQGLARDQLHGIVTRGDPVIHPRVSSLSPSGTPTRATVVDCFDDTHWIEYPTSGGRAKNAAGGPRSTTAVLQKSDDTWKVTQLTVGAVGSC